MKSTRPPLVAIFFMTIFSRAGGRGLGLPPGSATASNLIDISKPPVDLINIIEILQALADPRGRRDAPPPVPKLFRFHAVLGEIWQNRMLAPAFPPPGE